MDCSFVIPVYNEEEQIGKVIDGLKKIIASKQLQADIIVVDDGSSDRTREKAKTGDVRILRNSKRKGYGFSLKKGIAASNAEYICIIDGDGQYRPEETLKLIDAVLNSDMAVGKRQFPKRDIFRKGIGRFFLKIFASFLCGVDIPDLNSGLRIFKKEHYEKFKDLLPDGFSFTGTITMAFVLYGLRVKYIPVSYLERKKGISKINPLRDGFNFIVWFLRTATYFNPLRVFIPVSILLFVASLIIGIGSILAGKFMDVVTIVFFVSSVQVFLFALLADSIKRRKL